MKKSFKLNNKKSFKNNKKIFVFDNLIKLKNNFNNVDYFIYSPVKYDKKEICDFCENNKEKLIYLDMPVIVTKADIDFFKEIFEKCTNLGVYATNYYCFSLTSPEKTIISPEMNVFNSYAVDFYLKQGYNKIVLSKENFNFDNILTQEAEIFMINEIRQRLMYFKHCPIKEHVGGDCSSCKFKDNLVYNDKYILKRKKAITCQFYLVDKKITQKDVDDKFGKVIEIFE